MKFKKGDIVTTNGTMKHNNYHDITNLKEVEIVYLYNGGKSFKGKIIKGSAKDSSSYYENKYKGRHIDYLSIKAFKLIKQSEKYQIF